MMLMLSALFQVSIINCFLQSLTDEFKTVLVDDASNMASVLVQSMKGMRMWYQLICKVNEMYYGSAEKEAAS